MGQTDGIIPWILGDNAVTAYAGTEMTEGEPLGAVDHGGEGVWFSVAPAE